MECMGMYGWRVGVGSSCTLRLGLLCGSGATCAQGSTVVVGVCEGCGVVWCGVVWCGVVWCGPRPSAAASVATAWAGAQVDVGAAAARRLRLPRLFADEAIASLMLLQMGTAGTRRSVGGCEAGVGSIRGVLSVKMPVMFLAIYST